MPELALHSLPEALREALERAWPGCAEAQRRALLAPSALGLAPLWPEGLWAWQPASSWWRPLRARDARLASERFFSATVRDVRGQHGPQRLFDPAQPFFATPWTEATTLLRSPAPTVFSDADFWFITQQLFGADVDSASRQVLAWAQGMQADKALHGSRRARWLAEALWRLEMAATGTFV